MRVSVQCPECMARIALPAADARKTVRCPQCRASIAPPDDPPEDDEPDDTADEDQPRTRRRKPDPGDRPRRKRKAPARPPVGLWIGLGVAGVVVIGAAVVGIVLATRPASKGGTAGGSQSAGSAATAGGGPLAALPRAWTRGTVPGTKLSADFPGPPRTIGPTSNGNANVTIGNATLVSDVTGPAGGEWSFEVVCVTTTHADPGMQKMAEAGDGLGSLGQLAVGARSPLGGTVVRKGDVQGRPTVELAGDVPQGRQVRVIFGEGSRSYTMSVMGPGVSETHPDVRRFLDSARFE